MNSLYLLFNHINGVEDPESAKSFEFSNGTAIHVLVNYLLGEEWYSVYYNNDDINADIVFRILSRYSRRFRKDYRHYKRQHTKEKALKLKIKKSQDQLKKLEKQRKGEDNK